MGNELGQLIVVTLQFLKGAKQILQNPQTSIESTTVLMHIYIDESVIVYVKPRCE